MKAGGCFSDIFLMARTYKAVKIYQLESQKKQDMTPAQWNMLYGKYLLDMDEAI